MTGPTQAHGQEVFRTGKVSWNEGTSINILPTTQQGTSPQGRILEFFNPHLTHSWTQSGYLFLKSGYFFSVFKKGKARPRPPRPSPLAPTHYVQTCNILFSFTQYYRVHSFFCLLKRSQLNLEILSGYHQVCHLFYRLKSCACLILTTMQIFIF